ncbi:hypothetical protein GCM10023238_11440 [Streptomyces heliomycini]
MQRDVRLGLLQLDGVLLGVDRLAQLGLPAPQVLRRDLVDRLVEERARAEAGSQIRQFSRSFASVPSVRSCWSASCTVTRVSDSGV